MVQDVVAALGLISLGTRMRRIGERLQADTQQIIDEMAIPVQAGQLPLLAAIRKLGPLSIGELAEALGVTQPGVTRSSALLVKAGYLEPSPVGEDKRRRVLSLTEKGRELMEVAERDLWPRVEAAVGDLCGDLSEPLLSQLTLIEKGLTEMPLIRREKQQ